MTVYRVNPGSMAGTLGVPLCGTTGNIEDAEPDVGQSGDADAGPAEAAGQSIARILVEAGAASHFRTAQAPGRLPWHTGGSDQQGLTPFKPRADLKPEEVSTIIRDIAGQRGIILTADDTDNIATTVCTHTARPPLAPEQVAQIFSQIDWHLDPEGKNSFENAAVLLRENCPAQMIVPYINSRYPPGISYPELFDLLRNSPLAAIKFLHEDRVATFADFSGRWLSLKGVVFLLEKISQGQLQRVQEALRIFLKYEITPVYDTLRELVEFADSYPSIDNALGADPRRKNNYSTELREQVMLDFVYYQTNGHHKKAELLAWLLRRNRSAERVDAALASLRFIDEETIDIREITQVDHIQRLAVKARDNYWKKLDAARRSAWRLLENRGNREYVQGILRNLERELRMFVKGLHFLTSLEGASVSDFLDRLENIRAMILTYFPMFKVEDVFNHAISELRCDVGDFQTEAPSFYEAWLAEMDMAAALHSQIIAVQNDTQRPLLVVLNERTAPTYFGRDHLPKSYAQRFGIVQDVDDEGILDMLGRENISGEDLRVLGQAIFSRGLIFPLGGFKIASTRNDIQDNTLGVYIRNITRMMHVMGGNVAFVDMSRRRVGGSTAFLYAYIEAGNLASIRPLGKLQERNNNQFDGARGRYGLMERDIDKPVTWHLLDPCRIDPVEFRETSMLTALLKEIDPQIAETQYKELSRQLSDYLGQNKPFADDREHAFYSMHGHDIRSPGAGIAPRYRKTEPAWLIPDLEEGIVPIHEFLAKITARVVPEQVNGHLDKAVPYHRFPPYLQARVDAILKGLGVKAGNVTKRFYGSDCFGYLIKDFDSPREQFMLRLKLLRAFKEQKLNLQAVDAGIAIDIIHRSVNKGTAVRHFSRATGIPEEEIVRIGDRPRGNDAPLLRGRRAYNVGQDVRSDNIKNTREKGPEGVLEVMREVNREGFNAIALDIDGTIESDPMVLKRIKYFLRIGKKVAIITGRGESIRRKLLIPLEELNLDPKARSNLHIYLFNGGLYLKSF